MHDLILKAGPGLIRRDWVYNEEVKIGSFVDTCVTEYAHEYLFDDVTLDTSLTLADIFLLIDANPILQSVLKSRFCEELLIEARKGVSLDFKSEYDPEGIEFLELYQVWHLNTATKKYIPMHRVDFHGVGYELREDLDRGHGDLCSAGTRISWSITYTPLRQLLTLPICLNTTVAIYEDDLAAKKYAQKLEEVKITGFNLGQVLNGILWELSWHGGPAGQEEFNKSISSQMDEIDSGTRDFISHEDVFGDLGFFGDLNAAGFASMFQSIGDHNKRSIKYAMNELEDDTPIQAGLHEVLGLDVMVKPEFTLIGARAFRTLFLEARDEDEDENDN